MHATSARSASAPDRSCPTDRSKYIETGDPENPYEPEFDWHHACTDGDPDVRAWESQGAGLTFDLAGAGLADLHDATAPVGRQPGTDLPRWPKSTGWRSARDVPFADWDRSFDDDRCASVTRPLLVVPRRQERSASTASPTGSRRRRTTSNPEHDDDDLVDLPTVLFRGVTAGDEVGPYLSQFLLSATAASTATTPSRPCRWLRRYGAMRVDQRVRSAPTGADYMATGPRSSTCRTVRASAAVNRSMPVIVSSPTASRSRHVRPLRRPLPGVPQCVSRAARTRLAVRSWVPVRLPDHVDKQQGFAQFGDHTS